MSTYGGADIKKPLGPFLEITTDTLMTNYSYKGAREETSFIAMDKISYAVFGL